MLQHLVAMKRYITVSGVGTCTYYVLGYEFNKFSFIFLINDFSDFKFWISGGGLIKDMIVLHRKLLLNHVLLWGNTFGIDFNVVPYL